MLFGDRPFCPCARSKGHTDNFDRYAAHFIHWLSNKGFVVLFQLPAGDVQWIA
jgi:hypothetical protein